MGLTKWVTGKVVLYLVVFGIFMLIAQTLGFLPQSIKDLVVWFANNFLLISILLMFTMGFIILMRLTGPGPKRRQPA